MFLLSLLLLTPTILADNSNYTSEALADEVHQLPGLYKSISFRHFSGYLNVDAGKLHYWFIESQGNTSKDPLVLWLTGGPGCSGLSALVSEHGPFYVNNNLTVGLRNSSWNKVASIIYLESPVGVGYSYNLRNSYASDDDKTAKMNYQAMQEFYKRFPQYYNVDFYISGESYGAVYVPTLAILVAQDSKIPLKGLIVGNGINDFRLNYDSVVYYGYYHALIGDSLWSRIKNFCCYGEQKCIFWNSRMPLCYHFYNKVFQRIFFSALNLYDLYSDCWRPTAQNTRLHSTMSTLSNTKWRYMRFSNPPCFNLTKETKFFNLAQVKQALHVHSRALPWNVCSTTIQLTYRTQYYSVMKLYHQLKRYRTLQYYGDTDMVCNMIGGKWCVESLNRTLVEDTRPWNFVNENGRQTAGFVTRYENMDYLTVKGAGHLVPASKPSEALLMFKTFLDNANYA